MNEINITKLFELIHQIAYGESVFLSPYRSYIVDLKGLLDGIAEMRGITHEQNGIQYNEVCDVFDTKCDEKVVGV
jgi:hypothetical protein